MSLMGLWRNSTPFFGASAFCTTKIDRFRAQAIDNSVLFKLGASIPRTVCWSVGWSVGESVLEKLQKTQTKPYKKVHNVTKICKNRQGSCGSMPELPWRRCHFLKISWLPLWLDIPSWTFSNGPFCVYFKSIIFLSFGEIWNPKYFRGKMKNMR